MLRDNYNNDKKVEILLESTKIQIMHVVGLLKIQTHGLGRD